MGDFSIAPFATAEETKLWGHCLRCRAQSKQNWVICTACWKSANEPERESWKKSHWRRGGFFFCEVPQCYESCISVDEPMCLVHSANAETSPVTTARVVSPPRGDAAKDGGASRGVKRERLASPEDTRGRSKFRHLPPPPPIPAHVPVAADSSSLVSSVRIKYATTISILETVNQLTNELARRAAGAGGSSSTSSRYP